MLLKSIDSPGLSLGGLAPRHVLRPHIHNVWIQTHKRTLYIRQNKRLLISSNATAVTDSVGNSQQPQHQAVNPSELLFNVIKPDLPLLGLTAVILIGTTAASLTFPLAIGGLFDAVKANPQLATPTLGMIESIKSVASSAPVAFKKELATLYGCLLLSAAGNGAVSFISQTIAQRFATRMRQRLFGDILARDQLFFDRTPRGDLLSRLTQDVAMLQTTMADLIGQRGFRSLLEVLCSVIVIARKNPLLAVFSVAIAPILSRLVRIVVAHAAKLTIQRQKAQATAVEYATQRLTDVRTVQIFAQEKNEASAFDILVQNGYSLAKKVAVFQGIVEMAGRTALNIGTVAVLGFGGYLVLQGKLTVGSLLAFNIYNIFISVGLTAVAGSLGDVGKGAGALERIAQVARYTEVSGSATESASFDTTSLHSADDQLSATDGPGIIAQKGDVLEVAADSASSSDNEQQQGSEIEFQNVWFKYPDSERWILRDFNLTVHANESVAMVGASGSGKSTAISLLLGIYGPPQQGKILVDGMPVTSDTLPVLRPRMAAVLQEPMILSGTVADVIRSGVSPSVGNENVDQEDITAAAMAADAHAFISALPLTYMSPVGERGSSVSGGQRQRLSLARALIRKPKLLVLDEATSALDAASERAVCDAFRELQGCTRVMIAHRLSTARAASKIVVVEDGQVVEEGSQEELLMKQDGAFRRMVAAGDTNDLWRRTETEIPAVAVAEN